MSRSRTSLTLLPTGPGEPRTLRGSFAEYWGDAEWLPDGKQIVFIAMQEKHDPRVWVQDVGGEPRPISPEAFVSGLVVSPDGGEVATTIDRTVKLLDVKGGEPKPVSGVEAGEWPIAWSRDGRSLFVSRGDTVNTVTRVELATGRRTPWKVLQPADRAGIVRVSNVRVGEDEKSYGYSYHRIMSELYLVDGLR